MQKNQKVSRNPTVSLQEALGKNRFGFVQQKKVQNIFVNKKKEKKRMQNVKHFKRMNNKTTFPLPMATHVQAATINEKSMLMHGNPCFGFPRSKVSLSSST